MNTRRTGLATRDRRVLLFETSLLLLKVVVNVGLVASFAPLYVRMEQLGRGKSAVVALRNRIRSVRSGYGHFSHILFHELPRRVICRACLTFFSAGIALLYS